MNISEITASQLIQAANIKAQIERLQKELTGILETTTPATPAAVPTSMVAAVPKKRTMSAAARALISAAQKKRWAAQRGTRVSAKPTTQKKFTMSAAAKAAISKAAKARWAKIKAANKT